MESPLTYFQQRFNDDWLIGVDSDRFRAIFKQHCLNLTQLSDRYSNPRVLITESNPVSFSAIFLAACSADFSIFLGNPKWEKFELQQVLDLVQPDFIFREEKLTKNKPKKLKYDQPLVNQNIPEKTIAIPTGGTSGNVRFAIHTWKTLIASVVGFTQYFEVKQVNSCCMLPLYHVSGLMQLIRSFTTGGKVLIFSFKQIESNVNLPSKIKLKQSNWFISLVPTQLHRILQNPQLSDWLSGFSTVLIGGAPTGKDLLEKARTKGIHLAPTYGMTETASQVATLKSKYFLEGTNSYGKILPHSKLKICTATGDVLDSNQTGIIEIESESLALGYYSPKFGFSSIGPTLTSDDLGFFDDRGHLHVVGRCSDKILTGGENVFPAEVESAIRATNLVADVSVIGVPDPEWGEVITAVYVPHAPEVSPTDLSAAIENRLSRYKRPKFWLPVASLPRNDRGKVNRQQMEQIARSRLGVLNK